MKMKNWTMGNKRKSILGVAACLAAALISMGRVDAALIGYWNFNEGSGTTVVDSSGNGNNGTIFGAVNYVPGQFGTALAFDGSSTYVNVFNSAPGSILSLTNTSFTISYWMDPATDTGATQRIINKENGLSFDYGYSVYTSGLTVGTSLNTGSNNNASFGTALPLNQWIYLSVVYDLSTGTESVYQNAILVGTAAITGTIQDSGSDPLVFGQIPVFEQWYSGSLDEISMYNTALTQPEIAAAMAVPEPTPALLSVLGLGLLFLSTRKKKN